MTTRREVILAGAAAALAAHPAVASAATDRGPLAGLVAYSQEVVFGYTVALRRGPFDATERRKLRQLDAQAQAAVAALRRALEQQGGKPSPPPDPATAPPPGDPSKHGYLADLILAEELAVAAYYETLQTIEDERHLRAAAAFMAQSGQRLVLLRGLAGRPLLPRAFETGGP